ncbi:hypothetical protein ACFWPH_28240 [Nocardia sp. NPDC058499]|uniref:hypothetical protein n=1 Tax=Nocardia sp. NPDC058499 TaxID=3346530 RepID=UPI0036587E4E
MQIGDVGDRVAGGGESLLFDGGESPPVPGYLAPAEFVAGASGRLLDDQGGFEQARGLGDAGEQKAGFGGDQQQIAGLDVGEGGPFGQRGECWASRRVL